MVNPMKPFILKGNFKKDKENHANDYANGANSHGALLFYSENEIVTLKLINSILQQLRLTTFYQYVKQSSYDMISCKLVLNRLQAYVGKWLT